MSDPTSTELRRHWYLNNQAKGEYDLDILAAWKDYTGAGIRIAVIDNGFDYNNKDLAPNYLALQDHDYADDDNDAAPVADDDNHGTTVMGVVGAAGGNGGVVGVAYEASLVGYRIDYAQADGAFNMRLAAAITDAAANGISVANLSLGTGGYFTENAHIPAVIDAIDLAVDEGRGGKGTILVMAGGNTRQDDDGHATEADINGRTFDSQTKMIAVASVDRDGFVSYFSSYGATLLVSAFGNDITTTDRVGDAGYVGGNTVSYLAGTSYSAPMVSGIAALMLEANPDLGWRDVQTILAYSARHVGSRVDDKTMAKSELHTWSFNDADNWNGGGLHFSEDYGYGLVDATAAVRLAETWTSRSTSANQVTVSQTVLKNTSTAIPDNHDTGVSFHATVAKDILVERVGVDIDFTAAARNLAIYLVAPDGRQWELFGGAGEDTVSTHTFEFQSQQFRGDHSAGKWTVRIADLSRDRNDTTVSDVRLHFYGAPVTASQTYIYTDEFSDYAGKQHSRTLAAGDGKGDTLNAAAVTSAITVDLAKGTGTIDGVAMKISGIENVFGGDGSDRLIGDDAANRLSGGRGKDVLTGGKGADIFVFNTISDSLFGKSHDRITDFAGRDHLDLAGADAGIGSGDQSFRFRGQNGFDGHAGELYYHLVDRKGTARDVTMIYGDIDADKHADFQIELAGLHHLTKSDFVL